MNKLKDQFGRRHEYLRISVTDRCNLRCRYCMPAEGVEMRPHEELLTFDEIDALTRVFIDLGITKVRLTGGEPLMRRDIEHLCTRLARIPRLKTLAISTNGVLLHKKSKALRWAGVDHVNISLDTLRPDRFEYIAFRHKLEDVLRGIEAAYGAGFHSVKINTVIMKGFNDDELFDFVDFAKFFSLNVRFIEYMPFLGNCWDSVKLMPYNEMFEMITSRYQLVPVRDGSIYAGPAKEFRVNDSGAIIGFITTMTDHFCHSCNRLRLTADGRLRNCLFAKDEVDLKRLLRSGADRLEIASAIRSNVFQKWERHPDTHELLHQQDHAMVAIGG